MGSSETRLGRDKQIKLFLNGLVPILNILFTDKNKNSEQMVFQNNPLNLSLFLNSLSLINFYYYTHCPSPIIYNN